MGNVTSWISPPPPPGTFTLSRASKQAGEYANMTYSIRNPEALLPHPLKIPTTPDQPAAADSVTPTAAVPVSGLSIEVKSERGEGALAKTYDALLHRPGAAPLPCILKIANVASFPAVSKDPMEDYYWSNGYNIETARKAVLNEAEIYKYLGDKGLQGDITPRYWGIGVLSPPGGRLRDAEELCAVMEDAGNCLPDGAMDDLANRARVRTLYRKLHEAGVLHRDIDLRHILRNPVDGKLRLIDFDQARLRSSIEENVWPGVKKGERYHVEAKLKDDGPLYDTGSWHGKFWEGEMDESPVPDTENPPDENRPDENTPDELEGSPAERDEDLPTEARRSTDLCSSSEDAVSVCLHDPQERQEPRSPLPHDTGEPSH